MKDIEKKIIDHVKKERGFFLDEKFVTSGSVGAEIGVAEGNVSWYMMKYGNVGKIHLVDPWEVTTKKQIINEKDNMYFAKFKDEILAKYEEVKRRFEDEIASGSIIVHKMNGIDAAKEIEDNSLDWVFIDDDHTYEATYENYQAYIPKLKVGGYLLGDDHRKVLWFKVIEATNDILKEHPYMKKIGVYNNRVVVLRKES